MQNTNKHTPGPWLVGPEYENKQSRAVWHGDFTDSASTVARFVKTDADARLIASAPDLLAAAQEVVNAMAGTPFAPKGERALESLSKAIEKSIGFDGMTAWRHNRTCN